MVIWDRTPALCADWLGTNEGHQVLRAVGYLEPYLGCTALHGKPWADTTSVSHNAILPPLAREIQGVCLGTFSSSLPLKL